MIKDKLNTYSHLFIAFLMSSIFFATAMADEIQQPKPEFTLEALEKKIDEIALNNNVAAYAISMVENEQVVLNFVKGKADKERDIKANQDSLFRIGSISKMFAALAALKLIDEGQLDLNDKLKDLAPDLVFDNPWQDTAPVRLVHLLEHTTGWHDAMVKELAFDNIEELPLVDTIHRFTESRVSRWVPGTRHAYSNTGPAVTAYVVELATGMPFEQYVKTSFFDPLEMNSTTYFKPKNYQTHSAKAYYGGELQDYWNISFRPSGSLNTTLGDMTNYLQFMLKRGEFQSKQVLPSNLITQMETPTSSLASKVGVKAGHGLHNYSDGIDKSRVVFRGHGGAVIGATAEFKYAPELNSGFVLMVTGGGAAMWEMNDEIKRYLVRNVDKHIEPIALPEAFTQLDGFYVPINHRAERMAVMDDIAGILKVSHTDTVFHRSPLFAGWKSNDIKYNDELLEDVWTGLPSIAIVNDPVVGQILQVGDAIYQRQSTLWVFTKLAIAGGVHLFSILSVLYALFWLPYNLAKGWMKRSNNKMRIWPTLTSLTFIIYVLVLSFTSADLNGLGTISLTSVSILLCSVLYAVFAVYSTWQAFTLKGDEHGTKWIQVLMQVISVLHLSFVVYLSFFGMIALRTWVFF